jgi:methylmalonyl-CoA/ethylmalonyl-CoA epimerase
MQVGLGETKPEKTGIVWEKERRNIMFSKIHNVVIAVKDVKEAAGQYSDNFGIQAHSFKTLMELGIKNARFHIGDAEIELIEPLDPEKGPVSNFLKTRGEGLYMVEMEVEDYRSAVEDLKARGIRLIGESPESLERGAGIFIHPKATRGVLMQLVQKGR